MSNSGTEGKQQLMGEAVQQSGRIYKTILVEGEAELKRFSGSLWSAISAGVAMGFSFLTQAMLAYYLPNEPWEPLIVRFGYTSGFLIVILSRQQLFTFDTSTVLLPLLVNPAKSGFVKVVRFWGTILLGNFLGALIFAVVIGTISLFEYGVNTELQSIGLSAFQRNFWKIFVGAIFAGYVIASLVWIMPSAENASVLAIILITYVLALHGFSHIVAGSVQALYLFVKGIISIWDFFYWFFIPTLAGNIIGGTAMVAAMAQTHQRVAKTKQ
jgi:formate/nitrite transporter FocA (FNT family)